MIGKYQLRERLGRGGAAEVYQAYHPVLERLVAIKVLHAHLAEAPDFTNRFLREARAVAQLRHQHIVQVFDFDLDGERPYMVMEYVAGASLKQRLDDCYMRDERLPLPEVLSLFHALLDAVGYAHAQGMIHRDLKPANILLDAAGRPVLTDFGIARLLSADRLTASGVAVGTPAYMSPEQGQGYDADERSDLYALGIILFECLTGSVPFEADTAVALLLKHIHQPVPALRGLRPDLPATLEQIVNKVLAKDPAQRFQTAGALWAALATLPAASALPTSAPASAPVTSPLGRTRTESELALAPGRKALPTVRRRRWQAVGAAVIVLVLLAAVYLASRPASARLTTNRAAATADAWLAAGNAQLAADAYSAILTGNPANLAALHGRAQAYEQLGMIEEALADVETALAVAPDGADAYAERARLVIQYGLAAPASALADLDRAVALAPTEDSARYRFLRGWAILNFPVIGDQPDPNLALADLETAAQLDSGNAEYAFTLARALLATGRLVEALPAANRAVELDPDASLHRKLRAHIHFQGFDLYGALDDLTAAIELEAGAEGAATLYAERAYVQYRLQRMPEALADLASARALASTALLPSYVGQILDPALPRAPAAALTVVQSQTPDDPIWQAIFAELLAAAG